MLFVDLLKSYKSTYGDKYPYSTDSFECFRDIVCNSQGCGTFTYTNETSDIVRLVNFVWGSSTNANIDINRILNGSCSELIAYIQFVMYMSDSERKKSFKKLLNISSLADTSKLNAREVSLIKNIFHVQQQSIHEDRWKGFSVKSSDGGLDNLAKLVHGYI